MILNQSPFSNGFLTFASSRLCFATVFNGYKYSGYEYSNLYREEEGCSVFEVLILFWRICYMQVHVYNGYCCIALTAVIFYTTFNDTHKKHSSTLIYFLKLAIV